MLLLAYWVLDDICQSWVTFDIGCSFVLFLYSIQYRSVSYAVAAYDCCLSGNPTADAGGTQKYWVLGGLLGIIAKQMSDDR